VVVGSVIFVLKAYVVAVGNVVDLLVVVVGGVISEVEASVVVVGNVVD
jgi:hypothetical protein